MLVIKTKLIQLIRFKIPVLISPLSAAASFFVVFGALIRVSSSEWLGVWLGLEVNLFTFLVLINPDGVTVVEPSVKYFVVQCIGSSWLLVGFIGKEAQIVLFPEILILSGLILKRAIRPFHSWFPSVVRSSRWLVSGLLLRWQKLPSLLLLSWFISNYLVIVSVIILVVVGSVGGLNQLIVRPLIAYSSFIHSSWILLALIRSFWRFLFYWIIYSARVFIVFWSCSFSNKSYFKSKGKFAWACSGLFILIGLPPFLGFISKVVVFLLVNRPVIFFCVAGSLVSLKYYLSFTYSILLGSSSYNWWLNKTRVWIIFFAVSANLVGFFFLIFFLFS